MLQFLRTAMIGLLLWGAAAQAAITRYDAVLSGPFMQAPNASPGGGIVHFIVMPEFTRFDFVVNFGLSSPLLGGAIHCCTERQLTGASPAAIVLPHFPERPLTLFGNVPFWFDYSDPAIYTAAFLSASGGSALQAAERLFHGLDGGHGYVLLRTQAYPEGEIRGFITPIPEPPPACMLLAGLLVLGMRARRGARRVARPLRWRRALLAGLAALLPMAAAQGQTYFSLMSGPGQSPPNLSPGFGGARIDVVPERLQVIYMNYLFLSGPASGAGLHCCTAQPLLGRAALAIDFPGVPHATQADYGRQLFDLYDIATYSPEFLALAGGTAGQAADMLLSGIAANQAYVNLRSDVYMQGELRGFLILGAVPEPPGWQLAAAGLLGLGLRRMLRRRLRH